MKYARFMKVLYYLDSSALGRNSKIDQNISMEFEEKQQKEEKKCKMVEILVDLKVSIEKL